ncbi:MAG: M14 family metallopeptidase [Acidobacteriaceae bacterium]
MTKSKIQTASISAGNFVPEKFARGSRHDIDLDIGLNSHGVSIPLILVRGAEEGKTLVIMAGVHGDEYEGVRAILELCDELDPQTMRGDVLAVTAANPPALWAGTRTSPLDGCNMARLFPGKKEGSPSEVIAFHLGHSIIERGDFFLDLHSAGVKLLMPSMVGYDARNENSRAAAMAFAAPVIWGHPTIPAGRSISFASSRGIPWLYTEARGAGRIAPDDLRIFKRGIRNLLVHLGILSQGKECSPIQFRFYGDGDTDGSLIAEESGFFVPSVELLDLVNKGDELGRTLSLHGDTLEVFSAPQSGVVGLVRAFPIVSSGEATFLITEIEKANISE